MKRIILSLVFLIPFVMMTGCCTDDLCNVGSTFTSANTCTRNNACNACNTCSTCNTCGYDASYSYSSWY
ncbi:MAG: hypothetical protein P1U74_05940 [Legionellaceae bacterium]|nr:hypothetical protein [Legionellaceae bacterium]